jgi:DNA polymerase III subunit delta
MIIFLYGEDTYRMKEKTKEIVGGYKKANKNSLNLKIFDCSKKSEDVFKTIKDDLRQASMFKEKKLFVLINPLSDADFKEKFLKEAKNFLDSDDIIVFIQEADFNKNNSLFNFLKKNAKTQEFNHLSGQKLRNWAVQRFGKSKIEPIALSLLLEYVGSDLWRLNNEIQKLTDYKKDDLIKQEDVKLQVRSGIDIDIFKTIDAIAERRKDKALRFLQNHLEKGDSPVYLISMINYQFRNLLSVKDFVEKYVPYNAIVKKSGLHPFVVKKSYSLCRQFSLQDLKKIYQNIFLIDFEIKTGKISPEAGLELFIAEI